LEKVDNEIAEQEKRLTKLKRHAAAQARLQEKKIKNLEEGRAPNELSRAELCSSSSSARVQKKKLGSTRGFANMNSGSARLGSARIMSRV